MIIRSLFPRSAVRLSVYLWGMIWVLMFGALHAFGQLDYPAAHWNPLLCPKYYTTGNGKKFCVIHDMEGYYEASISYLNRCDTDTSGNYVVQASIHYAVNGIQNGPGENDPSDPPAGDITQCVAGSNYAWHAICLNKYSFGTEHEGFVSNPAWYTEAMYVASAGLQRFLCTNNSISMDRNHIVGHGEWQNSAWISWMSTNYPAISPTCNSHTDPGIFWDWPHFMTLINGTNYGNYWDLNGTNVGSSSTPSGTWDMTTTNWNYSSNGIGPPAIWGGKIAIFSAGSDATNAYTVTVSGTQTVNDLFVRNGDVTFTNGQLNFSGDGPWFTNYVAAGHTSTFYTTIGGGSSPDKWGPGTTAYMAANSSGGYYTLQEGTIAIGNNAAFSTGRLQVGDSSGAKVVTLKSADASAHTLANRLVLLANTFNLGSGGDLTFTSYVDVGTNTGAPTVMNVSNVTTFSGILTNKGGLTKNGPGTLVLSGTGNNTFGSATANGNITVSGGILKLVKTAGLDAIANGAVVLNSGGTLLLGAANQIDDTVTMTLNGGTFSSGGFSDQLGALKMTANSKIDLSGAAGVLTFADSSAVAWTAATILTITNWSGAVQGGGAEQLVFVKSNSGLTAGQLSQVRFINPAGFPSGSYNATMLGTGELVPTTVAPAITLQPTNQTAVAGSTVILNAVASGTPAPAFQWKHAGTNLPGQTASSLTLASVEAFDAGNYFVTVTNVAGVTNSSTAVLTVSPGSGPVLSVGQYSGSNFSFGATGATGFKFAIEASSNLLEWEILQTNTSPFIFSDTNSSAGLMRFYRARLVP